MTARVDVRPDDLEAVRSILRSVLPKTARVWVFGSRATWRTRRSSDLDLAVDLGRPLAREERIALGDAFEDSDLPYEVDVLDVQTADAAFLGIIDRERVPLSFEDSMDET